MSALKKIVKTATDVRRKALALAPLSCFFGTVLIAVASNLATSIGQSGG